MYEGAGISDTNINTNIICYMYYPQTQTKDLKLGMYEGAEEDVVGIYDW